MIATLESMLKVLLASTFFQKILYYFGYELKARHDFKGVIPLSATEESANFSLCARM
jgi:hypothetical protein